MTGSYLDSGTIERPFADLEAVVWREPPGWRRPGWLDPEPCAATLPMPPARFSWCLHAIGWSKGRGAKRTRSNSTTFRRLETGNRIVPDTLAIWLEAQVSRVLTPVKGPCVPWQTPRGWVAPQWLKTEWCPPGLPMTVARLLWCLHVPGWTIFEAARRFGSGTSEREIHEMAEGQRDVPDALAYWLEVHVLRVLSGQPEPPMWRSERASPDQEELEEAQ